MSYHIDAKTPLIRSTETPQYTTKHIK